MRYRVTAIVSAFNSAKFFVGCVEDLLAQTLGRKLEIVIVNSGSAQNERALVKPYLRLPNIRYVETARRETLYQAWNRGIALSSGRYLINANTDDRSRPDAFERMAEALDGNPRAAVVYSDGFETKVPNERFTTRRKRPHWRKVLSPDYSRAALFQYCYCGPRPMWRRRLHARFGLFDHRYVFAGDYDFWLRITERYPMIRLPEPLYLYYRNEKGLYLSNKHQLCETREVRLKHLSGGGA